MNGNFECKRVNKPIKYQSQLQQTTNFVIEFLDFSREIRLDISCESSASRRFTRNIKPHYLFNKAAKFLASAAIFRYCFMGQNVMSMIVDSVVLNYKLISNTKICVQLIFPVQIQI